MVKSLKVSLGKKAIQILDINLPNPVILNTMEGNNIIDYNEAVEKRNAAKNPLPKETTALNEATIKVPKSKGSLLNKLLSRIGLSQNNAPEESQAASNPVKAEINPELNSTQIMTPTPEPNPVIARIDEMIAPSPTLSQNPNREILQFPSQKELEEKGMGANRTPNPSSENPDSQILQFPPQSELDRRDEARALNTIDQEKAARTQQVTQAVSEQPNTAPDSQSTENEDPVADFLDQQMDTGDNKPVA